MRSSILATVLALPYLSLTLSTLDCQTACNAYLSATELSALYYQTHNLHIQPVDPPGMNEICMISSANIDTCSQCTLSGNGLAIQGDRSRLSAWQATCQTWEYTSPEQALECWEGWPDDTSSCVEDGIIEFPKVLDKEEPAKQQNHTPKSPSGAAAPAVSPSSSGRPQMISARALRTTTGRTAVVVSKEKFSARPSRMEDGNAQEDAHRKTDERTQTSSTHSPSSVTVRADVTREYASLAICFSLFAFLALWPPQALKVDRVFQSC